LHPSDSPSRVALLEIWMRDQGRGQIPQANNFLSSGFIVLAYSAIPLAWK